MEVFINVLNQHPDYIFGSIVGITLFAGIAILFFKNRKEYKTIKNTQYTEQRKKSNVTIDKNYHNPRKKPKKTGYQPKSYRGTDIETAAWEDATFEQAAGKVTANDANILDDIVKHHEEPESHKENDKGHEPKEEKINNVKKSLLQSLIVEIHENYVSGGKVSALNNFGNNVEDVTAKHNHDDDKHHHTNHHDLIINSKGSGRRVA